MEILEHINQGIAVVNVVLGIFGLGLMAGIEVERRHRRRFKDWLT